MAEMRYTVLYSTLAYADTSHHREEEEKKGRREEAKKKEEANTLFLITNF